ncbi:thioredoxin domain-containing protein [Flindersiella endophytica]
MNDSAYPLPEIVDRASWQAELDKLLVREKAHTREGDAIAAARRRLPMVEVDPRIQLVGANGPVPLIDVFEGRRQLITYFHMWHDGKSAADQCEGCTFFTAHARELGYLHQRSVTYATFCQGPYEESARYRDFMGWEMPWYSARDSLGALLAGRDFGGYFLYLRDGDRVFETYTADNRGVEAGATSYHLLDLTVYGRQENWEDSPEGWPQQFSDPGQQFRLDGRPTSQWSRLAAGRSDDLSS